MLSTSKNILYPNHNVNFKYGKLPLHIAFLRGCWALVKHTVYVNHLDKVLTRGEIHGLHLIAFTLQSPSSLWLWSVFGLDDLNIFGGFRLVILLFIPLVFCFVLFSDVSHELLQLFWIWQGHQKWCLVLPIVSHQATGHFEIFSVLESKTSISWWRSVSTVKLFAFFCN